MSDFHIKQLEKALDKIADLEAKLAESEKDRDVWKSMAKCGDKLTEKMRDEYQQLKQQLAEKDLEIERLKQNYDEVWEDTYFSVKEDFELNNNCAECRRYYAEEFNKQLANAIIPKFKIGDKCWAIRNASNIYDQPKQVLIKEITITKNCIKYYAKNGCVTNLTNKTTMHLQSQLFATKEEAEAKLKEIMKSE